MDEEKIHKLIERLYSVFPEVRWRAALSLGEIAKDYYRHLNLYTPRYDWEKVVPHLIDAFKDDNSDVQHKAAGALLRIGETALPALIKLLKEGDSGIRTLAVFVLGKMGTARTVPYLVDALKDDDSDVRKEAAEALGKIGSTKTVHALIDALKDKSFRVRLKAAEALQKTGFDDISLEAKVFALLNLYHKHNEIVAIGKPALPHLFNALEDEDGRVRETALWSLVKIAKKHPEYSLKEVIPHLISALKDEDNTVRCTAAGQLGKIGDERAVLYLIEALNDNNSDVRLVAALALVKIAGKTAEKGDYASALKAIKNSTHVVMKLYEEKKDRYTLIERKKQLKPFVEFTEKIHRRMSLIDKKKFPVKRQDVRSQGVKKPLKALHMK